MALRKSELAKGTEVTDFAKKEKKKDHILNAFNVIYDKHLCTAMKAFLA